MASTYGLGPYGAGRYGGRGRAPNAAPGALAERPRYQPAQHSLGIGPWATGVRWSAANYGYAPSFSYPPVPVLAVPNPTRMSFTLRRDGNHEAQIELDQPRGAALVIEEMITDLWWRRRDGRRGVIESIGRFNAEGVDVSATGDRSRITCTFVDYRGIMSARFVYTSFTYVDQATYPPGTAVAAILREALPPNAGVDLSALNTTDLGVIAEPFELRRGSTVGDAVTGLQQVSPPFDWAVETGVEQGALPTLKLWPGGRGAARGIALVDNPDGHSPIMSWTRRTNARDYANAVYLSGKFGGALATLDSDLLPEGQRDAIESDPALTLQPAVEEAATRRLQERSNRQSSWTLQLAPGFWEGRGHIDVGDTVGVVVRLGRQTINELHRVEEIAVDVGADGTEDVTLTVGLPRPSSNPASRHAPLARIVQRLKNVESN